MSNFEDQLQWALNAHNHSDETIRILKQAARLYAQGHRANVPDSHVLVSKDDLPAAVFLPLPEGGGTLGVNQRIQSIVDHDDAYKCAFAVMKAMLTAAPQPDQTGVE